MNGVKQSTVHRLRQLKVGRRILSYWSIRNPAFMHHYLGLAALLRRHFAGADLTSLCQSLIRQATDDPQEAASLMDAAIIFQFHGNQDLALKLQQEALRISRHYRLPAQPPIRLRLLALMAPGDLMANVPVECLLENSDIELNLYYATPGDIDPVEIPEHDVLFIAIGESEANRALLTSWLPHLADWPRPILNNPLHISHTAREMAARLLQGVPGTLMPPTRRIDRARLRQVADDLAASSDSPHEMGFPLLVRPLDSHAGHDLNKLDTPEELVALLKRLPGEEFFVSPFIDYHSQDGLFRKVRVILIAGQPFACHMAVSSHWMIHYLNAGMADSAEKRAEEATFMATFDQSFAVRHGAALAAIHEAIGLDYLGIDCAEMPDGRLLIFEVDHAMIVHDLDPPDLYPYKSPAMRKLFAAFRTMLIRATEPDQATSDQTGHRKSLG